jgi:hypothetical protein
VLAADTVQNYVSDTWPGVVGAGVAALTGLITLVSMKPSRTHDLDIREALMTREEARWEASVSGGTASWQDEIGS